MHGETCFLWKFRIVEGGEVKQRESKSAKKGKKKRKEVGDKARNKRQGWERRGASRVKN